MSPEEMKDRLKNVINALIRDNSDEAQKDLHDVLAAKMRQRINPAEPTSEPAEEPAEVEITAEPATEPAEADKGTE